MRSRVLSVAVCLCTLVAGCSTAVEGRGSAASVTSGGRTLGVPSVGDPVTRSPATSPTAPSSASVPPTTTGGNSTPVTTGSTPPVPTSTSTPAPATAASDVLSGPIAIGPGPDGYLVFQTPSGNIFCGVSGAADGVGVRCDLIDASYPDLAPVPCDFGDFHPGTASLDLDGPGVVGGCISDTVIDPGAVVLPYGSNAGAGNVVCHSAEDGVTCGNLVTGHGFQVARAAYRTF